MTLTYVHQSCPLCILMLLAAVLVSATASPHGFEPQCASEEDHGWPRFHSRASLEAEPAWARYFEKVYGELPSVYPVCVYDLWVLDRAAYQAAGLNNTRVIQNPHNVIEGDLFVQNTLGFDGLGIHHSQWTAAPNNSWVEVAHGVIPTEVTGAWAWRLRGTGVWFNVGRTIVFPTPADPSQIHRAAIQYLTSGCSKRPSIFWPLQESDIFGFCAREKGVDSIQFEPQAGQVPTGTFNATGLVEIVMVNLDGDLTCGVQNASETPLRTGWKASSPYRCENKAIPPACGLMPFKPAGMLLPAKPALCEAQHENSSTPCNPLACDGYESACQVRPLGSKVHHHRMATQSAAARAGGSWSQWGVRAAA